MNPDRFRNPSSGSGAVLAVALIALLAFGLCCSGLLVVGGVW